MTGKRFIRTFKRTGQYLTLALALVFTFSSPIMAQAATAAVIRIAVLDTGIDAAHPALSGKIVASINFTDSGTENDILGHGTHVAGIIVSNVRNVEILNVKVAGDNGITDQETLAKGIVWSVENGARIINISLTVKGPSEDLDKAIARARANGITVIAAAGNNGTATPSYPAAHPDVISVGATDSQGKIAVWSNGGATVNATAPGVNILSAIPGGKWGVKSGTSQAAAWTTASIAAGLQDPTPPDCRGRWTHPATGFLSVDAHSQAISSA